MSSLLKFIPFINICLRRSFTYYQSRLIAHSTILQQTQKKDIFKSNAYTNSTTKAIYLVAETGIEPVRTMRFIGFSYYTCFYTSKLIEFL